MKIAFKITTIIAIIFLIYLIYIRNIGAAAFMVILLAMQSATYFIFIKPNKLWNK